MSSYDILPARPPLRASSRSIHLGPGLSMTVRIGGFAAPWLGLLVGHTFDGDPARPAFAGIGMAIGTVVGAILIHFEGHRESMRNFARMIGAAATYCALVLASSVVAGAIVDCVFGDFTF